MSPDRRPGTTPRLHVAEDALWAAHVPQGFAETSFVEEDVVLGRPPCELQPAAAKKRPMAAVVIGRPDSQRRAG